MEIVTFDAVRVKIEKCSSIVLVKIIKRESKHVEIFFVTSQLA